MTEPTGILIALLILGAGVVAAMMCIIRRGRTQHSTLNMLRSKYPEGAHHSLDGAWWLAGFLTALLLLGTFDWLDTKDEQAALADGAVIHCARSQADDRPAVIGCSSVARRDAKLVPERRIAEKTLTLTEAK